MWPANHRWCSVAVEENSVKSLEGPSSSRGLRGGSWNNNSNNLHASNRNDNDPTNQNNNVGFRAASSWQVSASGNLNRPDFAQS